MVKYFTTEIIHPQTKQKVIVYCKAVLGEEKVTSVFVVYPEKQPFMMIIDMKTKDIEKEDTIVHNKYSQYISYIKNLFG